ncbi:MAG: hypothetical protein WC091_23410 [Sulfuricellaceae bacterium]
MNATATVDGFLLTMPAGWWVWKYDDSTFHRNQFQNFAAGSEAMDAVAFATDGTLWLIEVKDYRRNRRLKPSSVFAEVALKVRSTLAGLAVARVRANDINEKTRAQQVMGCSQIRVVLLLAQPVKASRLFPQVVDPADAQKQLQREVRAVDPHALCVAGAINNSRLPWQTAVTLVQ